MIPQDFIDQLLSRIDIVDVVDRHVPLKKSGQNYMACCPFHSEKSPSFSVSPSKQFYHCFGCGEHGNAITFLMSHLGLGFVEAVEELARSVGLSVPKVHTDEPQGAQQERRQALATLQEVIFEAARYYKQCLMRTPEAAEYLKQRGMTGEIAARYGLGYAPDQFQALESVFPAEAQAQLVQCGLRVPREGGSGYYDRFRGRIMFPIRNVRGAWIGFGGRLMGAGEPKYLNSPETVLFSKSHELYGLFEARQAIRQHGVVLVVEGYMDVVMLAQHGIEYAVATLGTATTVHHAQILLRQAEHVVFCFDGDNAGRRAAWRALETVLEKLVDGKRVSFLFLPEGHDPDSFVRQYGRAEFETFLRQQAEPLSNYFVRELSAELNLSLAEDQAKFLNVAKPLLLQIRATALGMLLRQRVAAAAGIELADLERNLGLKRSRIGRRDTRELQPIGGFMPVLSVEKRVLRQVLLHPELAHRVRLNGLPETETLSLLREVCEWVRCDHLTLTGQILERVRDTDAALFVEQLLHASADNQVGGEGKGLSAEDVAAFDAGVKQLEEASYRMQLEALKEKSTQTKLTDEERQTLLLLLQLSRTGP